MLGLYLLLTLSLYVLADKCLLPLQSEQIILQLEGVFGVLQPLLELIESLHHMRCH